MKVERIRKAYEQVADQLPEMINSGELKPGDRLPSEAELAADFGVSRTTVREALRILATRNLIHTRKGMAGGHFIVEPTVGSISEFLVANYGLLTAANTVTLEHLLQAREMIEGPAAAIAARNRDDARPREDRREPERGHLGGLRGGRARQLPQLPPLPARGDLKPVARRRRRAHLHGPVVDHRPPAPDQGGHRRDRGGPQAGSSRPSRHGDAEKARRLMDEHLGFLRANYQPGINSTEGFDQPKKAKKR